MNLNRGDSFRNGCSSHNLQQRPYIIPSSHESGMINQHQNVKPEASGFQPGSTRPIIPGEALMPQEDYRSRISRWTQALARQDTEARKLAERIEEVLAHYGKLPGQTPPAQATPPPIAVTFADPLAASTPIPTIQPSIPPQAPTNQPNYSSSTNNNAMGSFDQRSFNVDTNNFVRDQFDASVHLPPHPSPTGLQPDQYHFDAIDHEREFENRAGEAFDHQIPDVASINDWNALHQWMKKNYDDRLASDEAMRTRISELEVELSNLRKDLKHFYLSFRTNLEEQFRNLENFIKIEFQKLKTELEDINNQMKDLTDLAIQALQLSYVNYHSIQDMKKRSLQMCVSLEQIFHKLHTLVALAERYLGKVDFN